MNNGKEVHALLAGENKRAGFKKVVLAFSGHNHSNYTKKIDGITALNDHSSREGMRICIELRRDVNANVLLNKLYKHTQLQDTFGVIMLALVNNQPKVMNLMEILKHYLAHQEEVVTRRTQYDLNKARERAHILEGSLKGVG